MCFVHFSKIPAITVPHWWIFLPLSASFPGGRKGRMLSLLKEKIRFAPQENICLSVHSHTAPNRANIGVARLHARLHVYMFLSTRCRPTSCPLSRTSSKKQVWNRCRKSVLMGNTKRNAHILVAARLVGDAFPSLETAACGRHSPLRAKPRTLKPGHEFCLGFPSSQNNRTKRRLVSWILSGFSKQPKQQNKSDAMEVPNCV
jgi:hypothetical protein